MKKRKPESREQKFRSPKNIHFSFLLSVFCFVLAGCTYTRVTKESYVRVSLGGDYSLRGLTVSADTNGITNFKLARVDDEREKSFADACAAIQKATEAIVALAARGGRP